MNKLLGLLQIFAAVVLVALSALTIVDMALDATSPETISVVNLLIGRIIMLACLFAVTTILVRRGLAILRRRG